MNLYAKCGLYVLLCAAFFGHVKGEENEGMSREKRLEILRQAKKSTIINHEEKARDWEEAIIYTREYEREKRYVEQLEQLSVEEIDKAGIINQELCGKMYHHWVDFVKDHKNVDHLPYLMLTT